MSERVTPSPSQVAITIARREIAIAGKRRFVKLLFLGSLVPPLVMAVLLVVRTMVQGAGLNLDWDPLVQFLTIQVTPVLFLALAVGTPSVARDRSEEVLFLYATRPVTPWSYTLGKMIAVAVPTAGLLILPGFLIAVLRLGLLPDVDLLASLDLFARVTLVALLMAGAYSGLCVGASAAVKKARWALLLAVAVLILPRMSASLLWRRSPYALDAESAVRDLVEALFQGPWDGHGFTAIAVLLAWTALGAFVTATRVRQEMTP
ncbi:MAG: hypothetical protein DHS20C21_15790 [Gemmatimonadota bacterium]|nr:MAG: hypothetical protein DHS20C21_15790 [Gemmatimonadota bacterium]